MKSLLQVENTSSLYRKFYFHQSFMKSEKHFLSFPISTVENLDLTTPTPVSGTQLLDHVFLHLFQMVKSEIIKWLKEGDKMGMA